jgi:hypothetical protein
MSYLGAGMPFGHNWFILIVENQFNITRCPAKLMKWEI